MLLKKAPLLLVASALGLGAATLPRVTTSQYDNARSGANLNESVLSPANVNVRQFGKNWSLPVDGDVYAQPLYFPNVNVPGKGVRNLLIVATERDSVYAFDADRNSPEPLWHVSLLPPGKQAAPLSDSDVSCPFISPAIGITSTPVIDPATGTLYVLSRVKTWKSMFSLQYLQQLHALAITTGVEKSGGPVDIDASVSGTGAGSSGSVIRFDARTENPRSALLLVNGSVYLTWASSCDVGPYHGWVMAYDARTLRQQAVLNTSPDSAESGIWHSDAGPAADRSGNVYVVTGNGRFDADAKGGRDFGDTVLKLRLRGNQFAIEDYFTPVDEQQLNQSDGDLGSGGPLLLPESLNGNPTGLVCGGKAGVMYLLTPEHLGGLQHRSGTNATEISLAKGIYSAPAYWNGHLYYQGAGDFLKEFVVDHGKISGTPAHTSQVTSLYSGATPTVSANGKTDALVWLVETRAWNRGGMKAKLRVYDGLNVARELYSSEDNPARDAAGEALRFTRPTVANGRVYFGVKKAVEVYGPLPGQGN